MLSFLEYLRDEFYILYNNLLGSNSLTKFVKNENQPIEINPEIRYCCRIID